MAGSPRTLPTPAAAPHHSGPLAGVPVLLVAHQWAVVAQDLHGVLPVPARAAEILEADLWAEQRQHRAYPAAKGHQQSHSSLFLTAWFHSPPPANWIHGLERMNASEAMEGLLCPASFYLLNRFENEALGQQLSSPGLPSLPWHSCPLLIPSPSSAGSCQSPANLLCPGVRQCQPEFPVPQPAPGACIPNPAHHGSQSSSLPSGASVLPTLVPSAGTVPANCSNPGSKPGGHCLPGPLGKYQNCPPQEGCTSSKTRPSSQIGPILPTEQEPVYISPKPRSRACSSSRKPLSTSCRRTALT